MKSIRFFLSAPADVTCVILSNANHAVLSTCIDINLKLGIKYLDIYFDGPSLPEWADQFDGHERVRISLAKDVTDYAATPQFNDKQNVIYQHAYRLCRTSWLAVCDTDEFFFSDRPLADFISDVEHNDIYVHAQPHETLWAEAKGLDKIFAATHARSGVADHQPTPSFEQVAPYLNKCGLYSHWRGKYLVRTGQPVSLRIHEAEPEELIVPRTHARALQLVHFDAISRPLWRKKLRGKIENPTRNAPQRRLQFSTFAQMSRAERDRLFESLYVMTPAQQADLTAAGRLSELPKFWTDRRDGQDVLTDLPIFG